ncbi:MAG: hypothetical protein AAF358_00215 [Pseudomonadota bacterium]
MLDRIQRQIERRYDLEAGHRVSQFVVSDPEIAQNLGGRPDQSNEQLLLRQDERGLELALYLEPALVDGHAPLTLNQYAAAVEGVSHFTYVTFCARHDRSTTQLELELQGEVDKFFALADHLSKQSESEGQPNLRALHEQLFDRVSYREALDQESRDRYVTVNRLAAQVCRLWMSRYGDNLSHPGWFADARRFYRMAQQRKLRHAAGH